MKLVDKKEKTPIQVGLLSGIVKRLKNLMSIERPFIRYERLDIIYTPLFEDISFDSPSIIKMSLHDGSIGRGKDLSSVSFRASEMHLVMFYQNYCVMAKDSWCISLTIDAKEIPVRGRTWGVNYVMAHVDTSGFSMKVEGRNAVCVLLEDAERPKIMNRKNVITAAADSLNKMAQKRIDKENVKTDKANDKKEEEVLILAPDGVIMPEPSAPESRDQSLILLINTSSSNIKDDDWILDGGASRHVIRSTGAIHESKMYMANGDVINGQLVKNTTVKIGKRLLTLNNVFKSDEIPYNVISEGTLAADGIVNAKSMEGREWKLKFGDRIILAGVLTEDNIAIITDV